MIVGIPALYPVAKDSEKRIIGLLISIASTCVQDEISKRDVAALKEECSEFVKQIQQLFGVTIMTSNFHQVLHIPFYTENLGNLAAVSTMPFEGAIGVLRQLRKGYAEDQKYAYRIPRLLYLSD